ncbi:tetraacyldisaccharide 4'-kinase [Beggiatoa leptomitoformis]|uniref:Tetraacyldisaccharide 4'-kinase n=1 Tax=Beggiatoa leptomitoformis TaxID=288004 RepID=A0A2N9YDJ4_9GAMM|nr:tetraacyldisaccharide 4'-kinase [Beggiatoa leptomitoformis]ALG69043.1 tetraacyldisaccharide 4'-kinase [Beggiatoa leptomitoformis]AUI68550.1 tetraacyldisaccharide 4'-kinase [Beggiatoa leptomitoformis]
MKWNDIWYGSHPVSVLLIPFAWLYCGLVRLRRQFYRWGIFSCYRPPIPVIVVGNLTVGGTGKTPLVIWLARFLKQQGYRVGIVSRGYGGKSAVYPISVTEQSDSRIVGDEPILLAKHSHCPVMIAPERKKAVKMLLSQFACNIIISDDGLQHYALHRDIEIAVLDDVRRYGNRRCLPAGALREPISRLQQVDFLVTKGAVGLKNEFSMQYDLQALHALTDERVIKPLSDLRNQEVHAIAGIGHPEKFFSRLRDLGLKVISHEFPDHYYYTADDITFMDNLPVIMTEKDAVKCKLIAGAQHWYLPIDARLPVTFGEKLLQRLKRIEINGQKTA